MEYHNLNLYFIIFFVKPSEKNKVFEPTTTTFYCASSNCFPKKVVLGLTRHTKICYVLFKESKIFKSTGPRTAAQKFCLNGSAHKCECICST